MHNRKHTCLNCYILHLYAQNELILNLMLATGLKIVGTGACLPWCNISFSKHWKIGNGLHRYAFKRGQRYSN